MDLLVVVAISLTMRTAVHSVIASCVLLGVGEHAHRDSYPDTSHGPLFLPHISKGSHPDLSQDYMQDT